MAIPRLRYFIVPLTPDPFRFSGLLCLAPICSATANEHERMVHPNQIVYNKMEHVVRQMLDSEIGVPIKTVKSFLSKVFCRSSRFTRLRTYGGISIDLWLGYLERYSVAALSNEPFIRAARFSESHLFAKTPPPSQLALFAMQFRARSRHKMKKSEFMAIFSAHLKLAGPVSCKEEFLTP